MTEAINKAAKAWGIDCLRLFSLFKLIILFFLEFNRYEIRDIRLPSKVQEAMQMQVEAEVIT